MARRLEEYVLRGEIRNGRRNSVSGWLEVLRAETYDGKVSVQPALVMLSITGNLGGVLEGLTFRFEVRHGDLPKPRPVLEADFQTQQIGAMGDSVFRMVRVPSMPVDEYTDANRRDENPPEEQRASIYLEWYSQNGRVVLELLDPKFEFEGAYKDLTDPDPQASHSSGDFSPPEITTIIRNADGTFDVVDDLDDLDESDDGEDDGDETDDWDDDDDVNSIDEDLSLDDDASFDEESTNDDGRVGEQVDAGEESDPFALFPPNLEEQIHESATDAVDVDSLMAQSRDDNDDELDVSDREERTWPDFQSLAEARANGTSHKPRDWSEVIPGIDPATKAMYEQWDEVIFGTKDEPLTLLFEEPLCLPKPNALRDETHAWQVLSPLLAAMALRGVAFDMCVHFTAMQAYELLIDELLPRAGVHPNLAATGFVKHYCTTEHCEECTKGVSERSKGRDSSE